MKHRQNTVELAASMGRGTANTKAPYVYLAWAGEYLVNEVPWQNHARIGAWLSGGILYVFPGQTSAAGNDVVVEKNQGLGWFDA